MDAPAKPGFRGMKGLKKQRRIQVILLTVVALIVAVSLIGYAMKDGINFFRSAFYLPSILGGSIAAAVMWRFIFSQNGLVNIVLAKFGLEPIAWLADEHYSIWTVILLFTWQFGSAMVIFLAALQNVPTSLYEAAEIDGASLRRWHFENMHKTA